MPETPETADELRTIRYRIESIETTQHLLLRERAPQLLDELLALFASTPNLDQVYFAINGSRTQADVINYLNRSGLEISQPTVSRRMATLEEEGLIEKAGASQTGGVAYRRKEVVEKVLRLSKRLKQLEAQ